MEILYFTSTEKLFVFAELYLKNVFFPNLGYKAFEDGAEDELFLKKDKIKMVYSLTFWNSTV